MNNLEIQNPLPVLLTDGIFLFPKCQVSLPLEGNENLKKNLINICQEHQGNFLMISSKKEGIKSGENLTDFYLIGSRGRVILDLSQEEKYEVVISSLKAIQLEGIERIQIINPIYKNGLWKSEYQIISESENNKNERLLTELIEKFVRYLPNILEKTSLFFADKLPYLGVDNLGNFVDFLAQNISEISREVRQSVLASSDLRERLDYLLSLQKPGTKENIDKNINAEVNKKIANEQKIFYLREKLKEIKDELAKIEGNNSEMQNYLQRLDKENFPEHVKKVVKEEIGRYEVIPASSSEANVIKNYVDLLMSLPWYQVSEEIHDLSFASQILDKNHYGLEKVKKRIIEHLAVGQQTQKTSGQVICFVGPPGVGKTSLAESIAEATGRKMVRMSVGGVHDEAEIRGHRRTYLGSMPGKIIQNMKKIKVTNPLFLIDEIDKISNFRGDPASALLEVLDPNQNKNFTDNYLGQEVPYDLSKVMFICTANSTDLSRPLLDRMEIVYLSSYTPNEKLQIAKNYLIPKSLEKHKLDSDQIKISQESLLEVIKSYTQEAGVRSLNRALEKILRKFIVQLIEKKITNLTVSLGNLKEYLGKPIYDFTEKQNSAKIGIVNGLAYTEFGGDILQITVVRFPVSKGGGKLILTGKLGEVMKESAQVAFDYVRYHCSEFGINPRSFEEYDYHFHVPEGAVPKEGPSAGSALTTALISLLTQQPIPADIGMTGEITLHGQILPIGGLKEKAIAAHRSGLKAILIPSKNEKDIEDIPQEVRNELKIIPVSEYSEVWKIVPEKTQRKLISKKRENISAA